MANDRSIVIPAKAGIFFDEFAKKQARASFLKKRSKKLLLIGSVAVSRLAANLQKFFGYFFQKSNRFLPIATGVNPDPPPFPRHGRA